MTPLEVEIEKELGPDVDCRRGDFEAWVRKEMAQDDEHAKELLERTGTEYDDPQVDFGWDVWRAAESSRQKSGKRGK